MSSYLVRARDAKNNEFYTEYKTMEYLFESDEYSPQFCEFVKNKIIYLPCDTEDSNIYKYFVANKKRLQIKEILRTSDDYYDHLDLYEKCDLVFTNPPFTKLYKYTKWLEYDLNKKFVLWWSWTSVCYNNFKEFNNKKWKILCDARLWQGNKSICCFIFTNIESAKSMSNEVHFGNNTIENVPTININEVIKHKYPKYGSLKLDDVDGVPYIHRQKQFPLNYYEPILIPQTVFLSSIESFEFIGTIRIYCEDVDKVRFKALVKLKRPENEEKVS